MEQNTNCPICLSEPIENKCTINGCNHAFCTPCLQNWAINTPSCPLCRKEFTKVYYKENGHATQFTVPSRAQKARLRVYFFYYDVEYFPRKIELYRIRPSYYKSVRMFISRDVLVIMSIMKRPREVVQDTIRQVTRDVINYLAENTEINVYPFAIWISSYLRKFALRFVLELGAFLFRIRDQAEI